MRLRLQRYSENGESTLGLFYIDNQFNCYTLEDAFRKEKVPGETRIPAGVYEVTLRTEGKMHERYQNKFPKGSRIHKGMLWLRNVSNFEYVLIHIGNTKKDTEGCILVGESANSNHDRVLGFISSSKMAYLRIYPRIAEAIEKKEIVYIEVIDEVYRIS